jgi:hypothetical protein
MEAGVVGEMERCVFYLLVFFVFDGVMRFGVRCAFTAKVGWRQKLL